MAGEWIKMGVGLRTHPKVVRMVSMLKSDRLRVVGGLHAVWGLFDMHSVDGRLEGYTVDVMDSDLGWKGFSAAMIAIGWLEETADGLHAPDYEEHNGPVAKRRAMETSRKGRSRRLSAESPHETSNESGHVSACDADKMRNREEEIREEEKTIHLLPLVGGSGAAQNAAPPKPPPDFDGKNAETLNGKAVVALAGAFELPEPWGFDAEALGWRPAEVLREAEKYRQYWTAGRGKGTRRSVKGWRQTWSTWLEKAAKDQR